MVTFNGLGQKILLFTNLVSKLEAIDGKRYQPNSGTPLYDAMIYSFAKLHHLLADQT